MKRIILSLALVLVFISCTGNKGKQSRQHNTSQKTRIISVSPNDISIQWTAYKTTEKKPVFGYFKEYIFRAKEGNSIKEVLDDASLIISVNSINSSNESRDEKLRNNFFGVMKNPELIKGLLTVKNDNNGIVALTMNNITFDLPVKIIDDGHSYSIVGTMNLNNWKAQTAITALNVACKDKHKGADGISKTWSEVAVKVMIPYRIR